ncbi:hypothetical protein K440DRAFT_628770 [Wilcoxina mikolae CBS 423.85]|nr:hypothetical protein K440DRAFT_628770 [Wilcoxina mikolae CBS 423.85]
MDFYNSPVPGTFMTNRFHWFDMQKNDSSVVKVIAVSSREAGYWLVAYTMIVTLIFAAVTRMAIDLILAFLPLKGSGNRVIMLVAFYNANNPTTAALLMSDYCRRAIFNTREKSRKGRKVDWSTLQCALMLMAIAVALIGASAAAQFLVSGRQLIERRATRANPNALFYPNFALADSEGGQVLDKLKPIRGSAAYQTLGRYETSRSNLAKRVRVNTTELPRDNGRRMQQFDYSYGITGYEMGLQLAAELIYNVTGSCKTDYSGYSAVNDRDYWMLWPGDWGEIAPNGYRDAYNPKDEQEMTPFMGNNLKPNQTNDSIKKDGYIYSLTPHTEWRLSTSDNVDDPWYSTEVNPDYNSSVNFYGGQVRTKRGRPVLMCVQHDSYTLGKHTVYHPDDLKTIPDLKLSVLLRDIVIPYELGPPTVALLARNLGANSVASSTYYDLSSRVINAGIATLEEDFGRLVSLSFLYARETARNLPLLYSTLDGKGLQNVAKVNGSVPYEYADIILESAEVAALSVKVLVITPIICVVVWILVIVRKNFFQPKARTDNSGPLARLNLHTIGLQATQLYRCLDEELSGRRKWSGRLSMTPYIKELDYGRRRGDDSAAEEALGDQQEDPEPFVLPKLVQVEEVSSPQPESSDERPTAGSEPKLPTAVRINSDGRSVTGDQTFDLVMTRRRRPPSTQSYVGWSHVQHNV